MAKKRRSKEVLYVLGVCGAGTVTSTMLATRLEDVLDEEGIRCRIDEVRPTQVFSMIETGKVDLIITSTPIPDVEKITIPVINGHSLLSGFGEEETIEEIRSVAIELITKKEQKRAAGN